MKATDSKAFAVYNKEIRRIGLLSKEQQADCINSGNNPSDALVVTSLRLVMSFARKLVRDINYQFMDVVQEGNLGLMFAAKRFDPQLGYAFSTYAVEYSKGYMWRFLYNFGYVVRVPVHMRDFFLKYLRVKDRLTQLLDREPSIKEIADKMEVAIEKVRFCTTVCQSPRYLSDILAEDLELEDILPNQEVIPPDEAAGNQLLKEYINKILAESQINERDREIVERRFGLNDRPRETLQEIADSMNITRERVRQIEARGLERIRSHPLTKGLQKDFEAYGL